MNVNAALLVPRLLPARTVKPGGVRSQPNRKLVLLPQGPTEGQDRLGWEGDVGGDIPRGGPRQRSPRVHQHTPAVASGLVALHWLIEAPRGTLWDDNALTRILPGLFQGTLPLLVTRVDSLCKRRHTQPVVTVTPVTYQYRLPCKDLAWPPGTNGLVGDSAQRALSHPCLW